MPDRLRLRVRRRADVRARRRLVRAGERPPVARVDGREVGFDEAVDAAAAILRQARAPLVYGLDRTSCEAQRRAVALAEAFGAVIDSGAAPFAFQAIGSSTATFGEIRDRAELVVAWRADPAVTHPPLARAPARAVARRRRFARARRPPSRPTRSSRSTTTSRRCGSCVRGSPARRCGTEAPALEDLARRLLEARHVAFIYGSLDELTTLALFSLVRDLNRDRHAVTLALRDGNARGAEDVLAWQTGFPASVSFARGHPREALGAAALLERGDVDAALVLASDCAARRCLRLPTVAVGPAPVAARVAFATAADGIEVPGTVHRMDGVPVPLRATAGRGATERRGRAGRDRRARLMLRIAGGRVYDPANGIAGEVRDVCVQDGRIVADVPSHARRIDARGMVVMPGGVDIHAHIAGPDGQRRAQAAARGASRRHARPHRDRALRLRRDGPVDVRHRLPLRAAGLHDRRRGRHAAARGPPHARRAARHAGHRRRLPRADGQQPAALRAHPHRAGSACARRSPGGCRRPAATASSSSTRAASRCTSAAPAT